MKSLTEWENHGADAIVDLQLGMVVGKEPIWVNEHVMSSWCHLRIESALGLIALNFTLKLESIVDDLSLMIEMYSQNKKHWNSMRQDYFEKMKEWFNNSVS